MKVVALAVARRALRLACAIAVGLGADPLVIALVLTIARFLPNVDGLFLLWVPPILAIVGGRQLGAMATSDVGRERTGGRCCLRPGPAG